MPDYADEQNDDIIVSVDLMDASAFGTYEPDISCCTINFWVDESTLAGSYDFEVTLSDGVAKNTYAF